MFRISRFAAVALAIAAPALAADRFEKTISSTVDYQGGRVTIEHGFGRVEVHTSTGDQVVARGVIRTSDAELGKQVQFRVANGANGVSIRTVYPSIHMHGENVSYSVDLDVTIPERAPLRLRNEFGSIVVSGLRAPADIVGQQGSIEAHDIDGGRIENSFGRIIIQRSGGDTTVQNANGSIEISDVKGQLTLTNRFASVVVERIDGGLNIANSNGSVSASDVKGPASISNTFASVHTRNIGGPMSIASQNGNVSAIEVAGDLSVDARFGLVKVEHVRGNLSVDNANGGVMASDINGDARVKTTYASVFLKGIDGGVDVENQNGAIAVGGLRGGCNPVSLKTTFAPIKVGVGPNANYTVTARLSYGTINTEVPYTVRSKSSNETSTSETGIIGNGQCRMDLATTNGGIIIAKE